MWHLLLPTLEFCGFVTRETAQPPRNRTVATALKDYG